MGLFDLGIGDSLGAVQPPIPVVQPPVQAPQPQVATTAQPPAAKPLFNYGAQAPQPAVAPQGQVNLGQTPIDRQPLASGPQEARNGSLFTDHRDSRGLVPASQFRDALVAKGFSPAAAAGITGNAMHESGGGRKGVYLDPLTGEGTGNGAVGAMQWEGARQKGVAPTLESQIGHIYDELKSGRQGLTMDQLNAARTPQEAAALVNTKFERPRFPNASMAERQRFAASLGAGGAHLADAGNRTKSGTQGMTEIKGQMSPAQTAAMATDPQRAAVAQAIGQPLPAVPHAPHLPSYDEWKQQHNQGALDGLRPLLTVGIAGALIVGAALGRKHGGGAQMALSGLAGFVNGMAAGSHSQASKGLQEYHTAVQNLKDNYSMQRSEYTDILKNRDLNIDAKVSALKLKAAEYGDDKLAAAIEGGNIAAIDQVMKVRQQAMQHADDLHQEAVDRHKKFEYDYSPQDEKAEASAEKESASAEKEYDKSMSALGKAEKAYKENPADDSAREAFALAMQRAQMAREKQKEVLGRLSGKGSVSVGPEQGPKQDQRSFLQKNLPGFLGGQKDPNAVEGQVEPGAQQQEAAPAAAPPKMPTPGDTIDGYMFKGGDPASPDSWARHGA